LPRRTGRIIVYPQARVGHSRKRYLNCSSSRREDSIQDALQVCVRQTTAGQSFETFA
jgi:hypothetical protein